MSFITVSNPRDFRQAVRIKRRNNNKIYNILPDSWRYCNYACDIRYQCTQHACTGIRNGYKVGVCGLIDNLRYNVKRR